MRDKRSDMFLIYSHLNFTTILLYPDYIIASFNNEINTQNKKDRSFHYDLNHLHHPQHQSED